MPGATKSTATRVVEDTYDMANLYPRNTGLTHMVWVSPKNAPLDVRIKVCKVPGDKMLADETITIGLRPEPHYVEAGQRLPKEVWADVTRWIALNSDALLDYWNGAIDTLELMQRLRPLPKAE